MIKANSQARIGQKRTIRPLYAWHSAVPYACFLDTSAVSTTVLYPGQIAVKTTGEQVSYFVPTSTDATNPAFGLFNNFINGAMDELQGGTEISVWVGGRDAVFEVLAGPNSGETPLDSNITWTTSNSTRGGVALYGTSAGRLTTTSNGYRVARLIEAVSNSKIIVQLSLAEA